MRWFKHFSDNHRGSSVQYLLDELGYFGPFFYYSIFEMCAEKLDRQTDVKLTQDDCTFNFHRRVVCSVTRAKPTTVSRALVAGASCGLWSYTLDGEQIKISMPILLDLLDFDLKRSRQRTAKIGAGSRLEQNRIEKNRIEKNISTEAHLRSVFVHELFDSDFLKPFIEKIPEKVQQSWFETYDDKDWILLQVKEAVAWIHANPTKAPKSNFAKFFTSWLSRTWEWKRKNNQAAPKFSRANLEEIA